MSGIVVYCPEGRWQARVQASLGEAVTLCETWQAFAAAAPGSGCLVAVVEWLRGRELVERLAELKAMVPERPLVLVLSKDADAVRQLSAVAVEAIVWPHEVDGKLGQVVAGVGAPTGRERLARLLESTQELPVRLRSALAGALRAVEPIGNLERVAAAAGTDRRTLWRDMERLRPFALRLQDLLDWIFLVRLSELKTPARSWAAVAAEVGVHEDSLTRMVRRLTGQSLTSFASTGERGVLREFETTVIAPLLQRVRAQEGPGA